jgi:dTDP-4-dehydrorhamnose reductase
MKAPILVLGAGGQLGKEWKFYFDKNDVEARYASSSDINITNFDETARAFEIVKPKYVINCAAYTKVDQAEDEPEKAMLVNADAVQNLARLCREYDATLVHYSTDYIFPGKIEDREKKPNGYDEEFPTNPINVYGETKFKGEQLLKQETDNYLIIRVAWLCGRFGNNFVKTMLRLGRERDELSVVNDQFGAPSFAFNVVENTIALLRQQKTGTWHIASSGITNWYEFASLIFQEQNIDVRLKAVDSSGFPTKAKRPNYSKLSIKKLSELEDSSIIKWTDGLKQLLRQLR